MPILSLHDVSRETYEAIDVLELHDATLVWKSLWVADMQIIFHPGRWRFLPTVVDELGQDEPTGPAPGRRTIRI